MLEWIEDRLATTDLPLKVRVVENEHAVLTNSDRKLFSVPIPQMREDETEEQHGGRVADQFSALSLLVELANIYEVCIHELRASGLSDLRPAQIVREVRTDTEYVYIPPEPVSFNIYDEIKERNSK
jgi:hypothetical protein